MEPGLGADGTVAKVADEGEEDGAVDVEGGCEGGEGVGEEVGHYLGKGDGLVG